MVDEDLYTCHVVLVALYLRGAPRGYSPSRRRWPLVVRALRGEAADLKCAERGLREAGAWEEARVLGQAGLLSWAERHSEAALTPVREGYPMAWLSLPFCAPPAVWFRGQLPTKPPIGVVGSRQVGPSVGHFARRIGEEVAGLGFAVMSGGAEGCDTFAVDAAVRAGGEAVRILPCGLSMKGPMAFDRGCDLSACASDEPFSTGNAMERNALIYGGARLSVVVHARFREGGTWHGATDALRRKTGLIVVREESSSRAHRALSALGAATISSPEGLRSLVEGSLASDARSDGARLWQGSLFAAV